MQWSSDLIGYDALTSYGSPSYYAQMMFSTMRGDEILTTDSQNIPTRAWQRRSRGGAATAATEQIQEIFFDATRDSESGLIYLKVVNTSASARPITIQINGTTRIESEGELISLAGQSLDDTNSIEEPGKVVPRKEKAEGLSTLSRVTSRLTP
jgi:alpha-N-arabinofuranosidase